MLRKKGVVGKFVEFYGPGLPNLPLADRATIANMAPEYGATCGDLPGRRGDAALPASSPAARPSRSSWSRPTPASRACSTTTDAEEPTYSDTLELDLGDGRAEPGRPEAAAGPRRRSTTPRTSSRDALRADRARSAQRLRRAGVDRCPASDPPPSNGGGASAEPVPPASATAAHGTWPIDGEEFALDHGAVVIAAITSCTNTSNPSVMLGAGLLAKKAVERGPDAQAVGEDPPRARLEGRDRLPRARRPDRAYLEQLGFNLVGYGCTTCIGNSARCRSEISTAIDEGDLVGRRRCCRATATSRAASTPRCKMNYLASPPLVRRLRAGRDDGHRPARRAARRRHATASRSTCATSGRPQQEVARGDRAAPCSRTCSASSYGEVFEGDERWNALEVPDGRPLRVGPTSRPTCASRRTSRA